MISLLARALVLLPIFMASGTHAQITVDVSKITCEQFNVMQKADSVALWLGGYYHGQRRDSVIDMNKFEENVRKFRAACRVPDNFQKPIMQLIESSDVK